MQTEDLPALPPRYRVCDATTCVAMLIVQRHDGKKWATLRDEKHEPRHFRTHHEAILAAQEHAAISDQVVSK